MTGKKKIKSRKDYVGNIILYPADKDIIGKKIDKTKELVCISNDEKIMMAVYKEEMNGRNYFDINKFYLNNELVELNYN